MNYVRTTRGPYPRVPRWQSSPRGRARRAASLGTSAPAGGKAAPRYAPPPTPPTSPAPRSWPPLRPPCAVKTSRPPVGSKATTAS
eukprot:1194671-Prorocentrum_minimum.AAC.2